MSGFVSSVQVRFAHCDPAGIAYYPRLFELCDGVIEDWTSVVLGTSRRELHLELKLGLPTVSINAEFRQPVRLGDLLECELRVEQVGRSSVDLRLLARNGGEDRFNIAYRQVLFAMDSGKSRAWPENWRRRLAGAAASEGHP